MQKTVEQEVYLVLSPKMSTYRKNSVSGLYIPRITKGSPTLNRNEIALKLRIEVPVALFLKPSIEASISIPNDQVSRTVITPEIQDNIREIVRQGTGLDFNISVINPTEPIADPESANDMH